MSTPEANATLVESETKSPSPSISNQIALIVQQNQLADDTAQTVLLTFEPLLKKANEWVLKEASINVTDASQTREMKLARETRLALREIRLDADKERKKLKEQSLRQGKAIDGAANIIKALIEPIEQRLQDKEDFVEKQEAARKAKLKTDREAILSPFAVSINMDISFYPLGDMPQDSFDILLKTTKAQAEEKVALAAKAESDRLAKEAADRAEQDRIRQENEKLKQEAIKLAQERVEADKKAALERQRLAAEAAEAKKRADAQAAKLKAESDAKIAAEKAKADAALAAERKKAQDAAFAAAEATRKAKAESDRIAAEAAEKARKAQEALEAQARKDREAREKMEAEAKRAEEAASARVAAEAAAAKKAAGAPDRAKVKAFASTIREIKPPTLTTDAGKAFGTKLSEQLVKLAAWMESEAGKL